MIKIQEHLAIVDPDGFLDSLAEELWNSLNPKLATGKAYKKISLIEKCRKYSKETSEAEYVKVYANEDTVFAARQKQFFDYLLANSANKLKQIIISRPTNFSSIITDLYNIIQPNDLYTGVPGNYQQTSFGKLLSEKIFDYASFRSSEYCKKLFSRIGFDSIYCPYCNDNQLNIIKLNSNSTQETKYKAYLDLDHFYPKSRHPYFATSFFNLIPSCHSCNSTDKGDKPFTIETQIHPYHESFDDFYTFKVSLTSLLGDSIDITEIKNLNLKPLDTTLSDLNLEARYSVHLGQAQKLIEYFLNYKHNIGTEGEACFKEAIFSLNGGIPVEKKAILKHRLGKLNRDLLKQVDINNILNLQ
ncbi:HNH endonuclease family protein [Spirosoma koreense]